MAAEQAEAARKRAAAHRLELMAGISVVGTVAMVPMSMLIARAAPKNDQDAIVGLLVGSAIIVASCVNLFVVLKSRTPENQQSDLSFRIGFGAFVIAGCGFMTDQWPLMLIPLVPALTLWMLRFRERKAVSGEGVR